MAKKVKEYPWDPVLDELEEDGAYEAFCVYRDLPAGERTADEVARLMGAYDRISAFRSWYRKFNWKFRSNQYSAYLDKIRRQAAEKALAARKDHKTLALLMGHNLVEATLAKSRELVRDPSQIQPKDIVSLATLGFRNLEPSENEERQLDFSGLSDVELQTLQMLIAKAGGEL